MPDPEEIDPLTIAGQPSPTGEVIQQSHLQQAPDAAPTKTPDVEAYSRGQDQQAPVEQASNPASDIASNPSAYTAQPVPEPVIAHHRAVDDREEERIQARDQRQAATEQRRGQAEENRRAAVQQKIMRDQGVEMEIDPATGQPAPRKDTEGRVLFKPATISPFEKDDAGNVFSRKRDRYGREQLVPLKPKTDPETGNKYVVGEDGVSRVDLGPDEDFLARKTAAVTGQESSAAKSELDQYRKRQKELKKRIEDQTGEAAMLAAAKNPSPDQQARLKQIQTDNAKAGAELTQLGSVMGDAQARYDSAASAHLNALQKKIALQQKKFGIQPPAVEQPDETTPEEDQQALATPPPEKVPEGSDFIRGAKVSLLQLAPLAKGTLALLGATAEKATGTGGIATKVKQWGLQGYQDGMEKANAVAHENDDVTQAWAKAKTGDIGALVDWAQYGAGYLVGQAGETLGLSLLGGLVGSTVGPEGTAVGAAGGVVAKQAIKTGIRGAIEKIVASTALKLAEEQATEMGIKATAADLAQAAATPLLRKQAASHIGQNVAIAANSLMMEAGGIYPEAVQKAHEEGKELTGTDLAKVWATSIAAGGIDALTDRLGLDVAAGKIGAKTGSRLGNALITGGALSVAEGGTELAQTYLERIGANQSLTDKEAKGDLINSTLMGMLGGSLLGGGSSFLHGIKTPPDHIAAVHQWNTDNASTPDFKPAELKDAPIIQAVREKTYDEDHVAQWRQQAATLAHLTSQYHESVTAGDEATAATIEQQINQKVEQQKALVEQVSGNEQAGREAVAEIQATDRPTRTKLLAVLRGTPGPAAVAGIREQFPKTAALLDRRATAERAQLVAQMQAEPTSQVEEQMRKVEEERLKEIDEQLSQVSNPPKTNENTTATNAPAGKRSAGNANGSVRDQKTPDADAEKEGQGKTLEPDDQQESLLNPQIVADAKALGVDYQGEAEGLHAFRDSETRGNFSIPSDELSRAAIEHRRDQVRAAFKANPPTDASSSQNPPPPEKAGTAAKGESAPQKSSREAAPPAPQAEPDQPPPAGAPPSEGSSPAVDKEGSSQSDNEKPPTAPNISAPAETSPAPVLDNADQPAGSRARKLVSEAMRQGGNKRVLDALKVSIDTESKTQASFKASFDMRQDETPIYQLSINHGRIDEKTADMSDEEAAGYVSASISEELTHFAQYEAVRKEWQANRRTVNGERRSFKTAFSTEYAKVREAMSPDEVSASRDAYGDQSLEGPELAAEFVRQLIQTGATGKPTEATIRAKPIIEKLLAVLKDLLERITDAPASLRKAYEQTRAVLDSIEKGAPEETVATSSSPDATGTRTQGDGTGEPPLVSAGKKPKKEKPTKPGKEQSVWKKVGVNKDGNEVFEDQRGVRSYTEGNFRFTQPVGIIPGGEAATPPAPKNIPKISDKNRADLEGLFAPEPEPLNQNFWKWFGDSKVVDKEGNPLVVYHGTSPTRGEFEEFTNGKTADDLFQLSFSGISPGWFTSNPTQAKGFGKRTVAAYIRLQKPLILDADPFEQQNLMDARVRRNELQKKFNASEYLTPKEHAERQALDKRFKNASLENEKYGDPYGQLHSLAKEAAMDFPDLSKGAAIREALKREGYDGIILNGTIADTQSSDREVNTWVIPFDGGAQIKSADRNSGEFNQETGNFLRAAEPTDYKTALPRDKADKFQQVAFGLLDDGIDTPEKMAAVLDDMFQGRQRPFSDKLWRTMENVGAPEKVADWPAIYAAIDQGSKQIPLNEQVRDKLLKGESVDRRALSAMTPEGMSVKEADEQAELGVVMAARQIAATKDTTDQKFDQMVGLYERQPNLTAKTSTSKVAQAYSTPVPLGYLASRLAQIDQSHITQEDTAGNGSLLMEANTDTALVNELDPKRAAALREQGFTVTEQDATTIRHDQKADRLNTNPPFGTVKVEGENKSWPLEGTDQSTTQIDHAISLHSLANLKDDGRAVLIIGGTQATDPTARRQFYAQGERGEFFKALYSQYRVVDHFTVDGDLYRKQGAGWPVDVITIAGSGPSPIQLPTGQPPRILHTWDELKGELHRTDEQRITAGQYDETRDRNELGESLAGIRSALGGGTTVEQSGSATQPSGTTDGATGDSGVRDNAGAPAGIDTGTPVQEPTAGTTVGVGDGQTAGSDDGRGVNGLKKAVEKTDQEKPKFHLPYVPVSEGSSFGIETPANLAEPQSNALKAIEQRVGMPLREYVRQKLGYGKNQDLSKFYAAEQLDALASAIYNVETGGALILGDMTGVGKGRVVAGLIEYAKRNEMVPIFVTKGPTLYAAMLNDFKNIGRTVAPLYTNNNMDITNPVTNESVRTRDQKPIMESILRSGQLPREFDSVFTTYDQIGKDQDPEESPESRRAAVASGGSPRPGVRVNALLRLARGTGEAGTHKGKALIILDESHLGAGESAQGQRVRSLISNARVYYSSATFAKRPDAMPLYFKTNLRKAAANAEELMAVFANGGVVMQQVTSQMLAQDGQYIRRERSFDGVPFETRINLETEDRDRKLANEYTRGLRAVLDMSNRIQAATKSMNAIMAKIGKKMSVPTIKMEAVEFASQIHNFVSQYLFAIKAEATAQQAIEAIRQGHPTQDGSIKNHKVIVAVQNTMEGPISDMAADGQPLEFNSLLKRTLNGLRRIKTGGNERSGTATYFYIGREGKPQFKNVPHENLVQQLVRTVTRPDPATGTIMTVGVVNEDVAGEIFRRMANAEFLSAEREIEQLELGGMPLSPIDHIRQRAEAAGIRTGEITGRGVGIGPDGKTYERDPRDISKKGQLATLSKFNNENLDLMVINASGSTGISAHADQTFENKAPRMMIVAQPHLDINEFMQTLGRIFRSGQVEKPRYQLLQTALPAEKRPAAILAKKMASLNANTTSNTDSQVSQGSKTEDIFNEYGDGVVWRYLAENRPFLDALQYQKIVGKNGELLPIEDIMAVLEDDGKLARNVSSYAGLLPVEDQDVFWDEVLNRYSAQIAYLDQIGENKLKANAEDLGAETVSTEDFTPGDPSGTSAFDSPSKLETVRVKPKTPPMEPKEVLEMAKDGEQKKASIVQDYRRQSGEFAESYLKMREQKSLSDWSKQGPKERERLQSQYNEVYGQLQKLGKPVQIQTGNGQQIGAVIDVEIDPASPLTPSKQIFTIAVNTLKRTIKLPASQMADKVSEMDPDEFEARYQATREDKTQRQIVTGNLVAGSAKLQGNGSVTKFTRSDGTIETGILLPINFSLAALNSTQVRTAQQAEQLLRDGIPISADEGRVRLYLDGGKIMLSVPSSKSAGGRYWQDQRLTGAMNGGEMVQRGAQMIGEVDDLPTVVHMLRDTFNQPLTYVDVSAGMDAPEPQRGDLQAPEPGSGQTDGDVQSFPNETLESYSRDENARLDHQQGLRPVQPDEAARVIASDSNRGVSQGLAATSAKGSDEEGGLSTGVSASGEHGKPEASTPIHSRSTSVSGVNEGTSAPKAAVVGASSTPRKVTAWKAQRQVGDVKEGPKLGEFYTDNEQTANSLADLKGEVTKHELTLNKPLVIPAQSDGFEYYDSSELNAIMEQAGVKFKFSDVLDGDEAWRHIDDGGKKLVNALKKAGFDSIQFPEFLGGKEQTTTLVFDKPSPSFLAAPEPDNNVPANPENETLLKLKSAISELQPTERKVLTMRAKGELDEAIENATGLNARGVEKAHRVALGKMRLALARAGQVSDTFQRVLAEKEGERTLGRPDLANPPSGPLSRKFVDTVDQLRNEEGLPIKKVDEEVIQQATERLQADYSGERERIYQMASQGGQLNDVETVMAKKIVSREALRAIKSGEMNRIYEAATFINAYRMTGTEQARAFRQRQDWTKSPAERNAEYISQELLTPPKKVRDRLEDLKGDTSEKANKEREKMLRDWVRQMNRLKKQLAHLGLDLEHMTDAEISAWLSNKTRATRAVRAVQAAKADAWDAMYEYWISSILSAPPTQVANFVGNAGNSVWDFTAQRLAESMVNLAVRDPNSAQFSEFAPMMRAIMPGLQRASRNFLQAWRTESPVFEEEVMGEEGATKLETMHGAAIEGQKGRIIRMPLRLLLAVDEFSKSLIGQIQASAEAHRIAKGENLTGADYGSRIDALMEPGSIAWQNAVDKAKELSFQEEMGKLGNAVVLGRNATPGARYFLPFIKTVSNIFRSAVRKSPLGTPALLYRMARQGAVNLQWDGSGYRYTRKEFVQHAAEQMLAWTVFFALRGLVEPGDDDLPALTGTVPYEFSKRGQRDLAYRTAPPMSIRIGKEWYSYGRIEPFATAIGMMVDGLNALRDSKNGLDHTTALGELMKHLTAQVKDKTFARGIGDFLNAIEDGASVTEWLGNFATSWVPNIIRTGAKESDSMIREQKVWGRGEEWADRLKDRLEYKALPLAANAPQPKVDLWGREIQKDAGISPGTDWLWRMMSPARSQPGGNVETPDRAILNWNNAHPNERFAPQAPPTYWMKNVRQPDGSKKEVPIYMTDGEYNSFLQTSGRAALALVNMAGINAENPTRADLKKIDESLEKARRMARDRLWQERIRRTVGDPFATKAGSTPVVPSPSK